MKRVMLLFLLLCMIFIGNLHVNAEVAENTLGKEILLINPNGLNPSKEGGMYRFQGENNVNNYICFGTNDKNDCIEKADKFMYRIIGISDNGEIKVIKYKALSETYKWNEVNKPENLKITWGKSDIYENINGDIFLTNKVYIPDGWENLITTSNWKYGDYQSDGTSKNTAVHLFNSESAWTNSLSAKIALMYYSDYLYGMPGGNNCSTGEEFAKCKTSWIHLSNNDIQAPSENEWTMSRYGWTDYQNINTNLYKAYKINSNGVIITDDVTNSNSIRPVFYITSEKKVASGNGSFENPFIIGDTSGSQNNNSGNESDNNTNINNDNNQNNNNTDNNLNNNGSNTNNNNNQSEENPDQSLEEGPGTGMSSNIISFVLLVVLSIGIFCLNKTKKNKFNKI